MSVITTFACSSAEGSKSTKPAAANICAWVEFTVSEGRYAIPLTAVERIVAAAEVTPLPGAPGAIHGVVNVGGEVLPVFDLRRRLSLPARAIMPTDQFLILHAAGRKTILLIDNASGILNGRPETLIGPGRIAPQGPHIAGVLISEDGLVLIHDVDAFLSSAESLELDAAMANSLP